MISASGRTIAIERGYLHAKPDGGFESYSEMAERAARANTSPVSPVSLEEGELEALRDAIASQRIMPSGRILAKDDPAEQQSCMVIAFGGDPEAFVAQIDSAIQKECGFGINYSDFTNYGVHPVVAMHVVHTVMEDAKARHAIPRPMGMMSILHYADPHIFEFIEAKKDGGLFATNISVEVDDSFFAGLDSSDGHALLVLDRVVEGMRLNGEPGLFNSSLASVGEPVPVRATAPCGELALRPGEPCVLMHVNLAACSDSEILEVFRLTARACVRTASATGTQRIGVGFLGLQEYMAQRGLTYRDPDHSQIAETLRTFHHMVRVASDKYTTELGVPQLLKVTAVAPTGTIAKLTDTTEGAQPVFADYFLLRTRVDKGEVATSDGSWYEECSDDPTKVVLVRLCESSVVRRHGTALIDDTFELKVGDHLRMLEMIQANYADNGVSYTVNFHTSSLTHEEQVALLRNYMPRLKGVTFLPNGSYVQPPYEPITIAQAKALGIEAVQMSADPCRGRCSL